MLIPKLLASQHTPLHLLKHHSLPTLERKLSHNFILTDNPQYFVLEAVAVAGHALLELGEFGGDVPLVIAGGGQVE